VPRRFALPAVLLCACLLASGCTSTARHLVTTAESSVTSAPRCLPAPSDEPLLRNQIPDVTCLSFAKAKAMLRKLGYTNVRSWGPGDTGYGHVVLTSPSARSIVADHSLPVKLLLGAS
jgi:hypothetical protein